MGFRGTPEQRFIKKVKQSENGCWEWTGCFDGEPRDGENKRGRYGRFALDGYNMIGAHRASYMLFVGAVPDGMLVCHKCDNPSCVNPKHLFLGRAEDNMQDMVSKKRHACQKEGYRHWNLGNGRLEKHDGKYGSWSNCCVCGEKVFLRSCGKRTTKNPVCSKECFGKFISTHQRNRIIKNCSECGKEISIVPSTVRDNNFCSRSCLGKHSTRIRWSKCQSKQSGT